MVEDIFGLLDSRLYDELVKQGFQTPTPIQVRSIPRILSDESVLLIAPTGHGKTEAAFLPLIHNYELPINHQKNYHYFFRPQRTGPPFPFLFPTFRRIPSFSMGYK